jgi:hypothetical protein
VLVRWWRGIVFERVERIRKKTAFQAWVLANRAGWKSFVVAMLAAVQLFVLGAIKAARTWVSRFNLARRVHAYLFRRELDRLGDQGAHARSRGLPEPFLRALEPNAEIETWISCPADDWRAELRARVLAHRGGAVAIVGGRGSGKSAFMHELRAELPQSLTIDCVALTAESPMASIQARVQAWQEGDAGKPPPLVLLDEAHALVKPVLGGLQAFDEVLAFARAGSKHTLWVFAIDDVIWPFLRRARDARPLFDQVHALAPWTEEQLAELLSKRSAKAGFAPAFDDLLEPLPPSADEIDRQEALAARRIAYFRMLWDYVGGNPGMALEVWRSALVEAEDGSIRVKPLQAPDARELDLLPDASLFILRAVLQMPLATVGEIALATRLTVPQVRNAVRFGQGHGFVVERGDRVEVPWRWRRSVLRMLYRRQLLVNV